MISSVRFNDVVIVESTSEELRSGSWNNAFRNASLNWSPYAYIDDNGHWTPVDTNSGSKKLVEATTATRT